MIIILYIKKTPHILNVLLYFFFFTPSNKYVYIINSFLVNNGVHTHLKKQHKEKTTYFPVREQHPQSTAKKDWQYIEKFPIS